MSIIVEAKQFWNVFEFGPVLPGSCSFLCLLLKFLCLILVHNTFAHLTLVGSF